MSKAINTKEDLEILLDCAKNYFEDGIYVKSKAHPCGWDFIDFYYFHNVSDLINMPVLIGDISNGVYETNPFENKTVYDILKEVGECWCFERTSIDW